MRVCLRHRKGTFYRPLNLADARKHRRSPVCRRVWRQECRMQLNIVIPDSFMHVIEERQFKCYILRRRHRRAIRASVFTTSKGDLLARPLNPTDARKYRRGPVWWQVWRQECRTQLNIVIPDSFMRMLLKKVKSNVIFWAQCDYNNRGQIFNCGEKCSKRWLTGVWRTLRSMECPLLTYVCRGLYNAV